MIGAIWKLIQINLHKEKENALKLNDRQNEDICEESQILTTFAVRGVRNKKKINKKCTPFSKISSLSSFVKLLQNCSTAERSGKSCVVFDGIMLLFFSTSI